MKKIILKIGILLIVIGFLCIISKGFNPEYIDENGILREYFFLLPIGFGSFCIGIILSIVSKFFKK